MDPRRPEGPRFVVTPQPNGRGLSLCWISSKCRGRHTSALPDTGSYEGKFADGRPSQYFYFDDVPGRRLRPEILTSEQALEQAKAYARAERDKE